MRACVRAAPLPLSSPLNKEKRRGTFVCAGCGSPLFSSEAKYNSGTGWPSFFEPLDGACTPALSRLQAHRAFSGAHAVRDT